MKRAPLLLATSVAVIAVNTTMAQSNYEQHVVFDNYRADRFYYYSRASFVAPSALEIDHGHLPLAFDHVHSPPNSLKLRWSSASGGDWRVSIAAHHEERVSHFTGDALIFWAYSPEPLAAEDAPRIQLVDAQRRSTPVIRLTGSLSGLAAGQWTRIVLPVDEFKPIFQETHPEPFDLSQLAQVILTQNLDDGHEHTLYLDDIRVGDAMSPEHAPPEAPTMLTSTGYERHVELQWSASRSPSVESYRIYRAESPKGSFTEIGSQRGEYIRYDDFIGPGREAHYQVRAVDTAGRESPASPATMARTHPMTDDELLTMVQRGNFNYYWDGAHPNAGMALEARPGDENMVALGASGFGIMALITGIDRHFITRTMGIERMQKILGFLQTADRYHGAWSHFLDGRSGKTMPVFGEYDNGGDLVETAFLMQGLLTARQYFDQNTPAERALREAITALWQGVEWDWYRRSPDSGFLFWHWSPTVGFYIQHPLIGWNETLIVYLLAIASPTHPAPASLWNSGWASQSDLALAYRQGWSKTRDGDHFTNGHVYYETPLEVGEGNGAELFFTQFSFLGFDPRGLRDAYTNYFENNRAIARISHAYAIDNPRHCEGYGDDFWGQSAGRHTAGGRARPADDNCTVVIHAALGSMPYTPTESMAALHHYYRDLGPHLWGVYGFSDSLNPTDGWNDEVYTGLNQAQTVVMIENYRSGLLWRLFMRNPEIAPALQRIGFRPDP